jgi:seryl-tRNA synthetase
MFDLKWIREQPEAFDKGLARRGLPPQSPEILRLDKVWREAQTEAERLQAERNRLSKEIGNAKAKGQDVAALLKEVAASKDRQAAMEAEAAERYRAVEAALAVIPNVPADDVPDGHDASANREMRRHGTPPSFGFKPRDHAAIGEALGLMDFARAGKLSGARFVVLRGQLARLERALAQFMIDIHTREFGYTEVSPPLLVRDEAVYGTGSLPKFADDLFRTTTGLWLIPTAEVPLTNLVADEILEEARLPLRFTAWTPCFRSEAGAAGKDTRGLIRQHQFEKVELVWLAAPEASADALEALTHDAEALLVELELPHRVVALCAGDTGYNAAKTYDIEVWIPSSRSYREISSCSNCTDFQARRAGIRFRREPEAKPELVYTLNGSGLAIGRTLVAILENYQQRDGTVTVPKALQPYAGFARIAP